MNNVKLLGLTAGVSTLIFAGNATADFNGISWTSSSSAFGDTYLIYADLDAGSQLNAVYGDDNVALNIAGTRCFLPKCFWWTHSCRNEPSVFPCFSKFGIR